MLTHPVGPQFGRPDRRVSVSAVLARYSAGHRACGACLRDVRTRGDAVAPADPRPEMQKSLIVGVEPSTK